MSGTQLLGLRWDGVALHVELVQDVVGGDCDRARTVREVLGRHARGQRQPPWSYAPRSSLTQTVLSALVEESALFAEPLPPLRELLPLPEDLRPQDAGERDPERTAAIVEVPVPPLCLLLTAAADRVQLREPWNSRYEPYGPVDDDGVVRLGAWRH